MLLKKTVLLIVSLAILSLIVFVFFQTAKHPKIERIRLTFKDKAAVIYDNLLDSVAPARKYPISTIDLEESLKNNLPLPFASFNQDEWDWFWKLLYGRYTIESNGWPRRKRQLTKQEIQNELADYYKPFDRFGEKQWDIFWQQILRGKAFKR